MKVTEKPVQDRPREKMQKYGASKLSDLELLMAIVGSGSGAADVTKIARDLKKLIALKGSELTLDDLMSVKGMAIAKTTQFMAAFELWKRQFEVTERPVLDSPEKAVEQLVDIRDKNRNISCA
jgi:DNA repair protein RadC